MAENKQNTTPERRPDCVTEIRMGNTVLVVSGFFKKDTTDTAADTVNHLAVQKFAHTPLNFISIRTLQHRFCQCFQIG